MRTRTLLFILVSFGAADAFSADSKVPLARRIRIWEESQQNRLLEEYRKIGSQISSELRAIDTWFQSESKNAKAFPESLVPSGKIQSFLENERKKRIAFQSIAAAQAGSCLSDRLEKMTSTANSLRRNREEPPEVSGLGCKALGDISEKEKSRQAQLISLGSLSKVGDEIARETEKRRLAEEEKAKKQEAATKAPAPTPAQAPTAEKKLEVVQKQPAPAPPQPETSMFKIYVGRKLLVNWIWGGQKLEYQHSEATTARVLKFIRDGESTDMSVGDKGELVLQGRPLVHDLWIAAPNQPNTYVKDPAVDEWHTQSLKNVLAGRMFEAKKARFEKQVQAMTEKSTEVEEPVPFHFQKSVEPPLDSEILVVEDRFGRDLTQHGITLLDWEGYLANPAALFRFRRPQGSKSAYLNVALSIDDSRYYFSEPSQVDESGATKFVSLDRSGESTPLYVSIFPDRNNEGEQRNLVLDVWESKTSERNVPTTARRITIPIHVVDEDTRAEIASAPAEREPSSWPFLGYPTGAKSRSRFPYPPLPVESVAPQKAPYMISLDFDLDPTGFLKNKTPASAIRRDIFQTAAADWYHFIGDMGLRRIAAGQETTKVIIPQRGVSEADEKPITVPNSFAFSGFLIYVLASPQNLPISSRGGATGEGLQTGIDGKRDLRMSGQVLIEGIQRADEFITDLSESIWWKSLYPQSPVDLYSLAIHEVGHCLFADKTYPRFEKWKTEKIAGAFTASDYQGVNIPIDDAYHLSSDVDRESMRGSFGALGGKMPQHRWLITKLDLLLLAEMGYRVIQSASQSMPKWTAAVLPRGTKGVAYSHKFSATGGIPDYFWGISEGRLPKGLELDSYTGEISGTPQEGGDFHVVIQFRDNSNQLYGFEKRYFPMNIAL